MDNRRADDGRNPVDDLAQDIRRVDGSHSLGAGALAQALHDLGWRKQPEPEWWTEYRSAVVYLATDGTVDSIRETGPTRRTVDAAREDALDDEPSMDVQDDEPPVARAIVARTRFEPGAWEPVEMEQG